MFIKINIQNNDKFRLQGYDIVTDLYLTPWEAALGKRVNIDSIEDQFQYMYHQEYKAEKK